MSKNLKQLEMIPDIWNINELKSGYWVSAKAFILQKYLFSISSRPPKLTGYDMTFKNRDKRRRGGSLATYYKTDAHITITDTTALDISKSEFLTININNKITIIAIYINEDKGELNQA